MQKKYEYFNQTGFTLVETVIALGVLGIFFVAVAGITGMVLDIVGQSRARTIATALAQERLEYIRNLSYDDIGTIGGIPPGGLLQEEVVTMNGLEVTLNISVFYVDDEFDGVTPDDTINTDYKRVRLSVSWGGAFASANPMVFVSDVTPQGLESESDGGTLSIVVFDANGVALPQATVHVANTTVTPVIDLSTQTDTQGRVYIPGSPPCISCYQITVTKPGYSTDRTYSQTEVTNPAKPPVTILDGQITELTFIIDRLATLTVYATGARENNYPAFTGVQFILTGSKTIGTDTIDTPVPKYTQTHTTLAGGQVTISDLELDTYIIDIPNNSSVDIAGSNPLTPFAVSPGSNSSIRFVTNPQSAHSLLVTISDSNNTPVQDASITLKLQDVVIATKSSGAVDKGDFGQAFFPQLTETLYDLIITHPSYQEATASTGISGDINDEFILSQ